MWSLAIRTEQAHRVDCELLQDLETTQDDVVVVYVAKQVQAAMIQHFWYVSETLGGLAFFEYEEETECAGEPDKAGIG